MPKRKAIKGIVGGIASSFASRNNDSDGYWTMGIVCKIVRDSGANHFTLDLATGESRPEYKYSSQIAAPYYDSILRQITKLGFTEEVIRNTMIEVEFNVPSSKSQIASEWLDGSPFICRAIIVDDLNRVWSANFDGWCRPHDPKKERRSVRRFPS